MADEQDDPPALPKPPPRRRRRRLTPTIDLKATEVAIEPKEAPAAAPGESSEPSRADADPPRRRKAATSSSAEQPAAGRSAAGQAPPEEPPAASRGGPGPGRHVNWPLAGAGAAGGLVIFLLFVVLWLAGVLSQNDGRFAALNERLSLAEVRFAEITSRPALARPDTKAADELAARLAKLEQAVAAAAARPATGDTASASRLAAIEEAIKSLQGNIADLARRADDNAAATREARGRADASLLAADAARSAVERSNVEALGNRIAALERTTTALADELAKRTTSSADRPLRLAVAAQVLRAAVERGDPFAAELAAVKPLAPDPQALTPLEAFAASGAPTQAALARQLSELTPVMLRLAEAPAAGGSFFERLQANAERLVRIRPIDEAPGGDPAAIISRIEAKAARSDIAGALTELAQLPAPVRAPAEEWIKQAQGRNAAVAANRQLASDALAALGGPSP